MILKICEDGAKHLKNAAWAVASMKTQDMKDTA